MNHIHLENRLFYVMWGGGSIAALAAILLRGSLGDLVLVIPAVGGGILGVVVAGFLVFRKHRALALEKSAWLEMKAAPVKVSIGQGYEERSVMLRTQLEVMKLQTVSSHYCRIRAFGYLSADQDAGSVRTIKSFGINRQPVTGTLNFPTHGSGCPQPA